ncbi:lysophospholipid acyltransferase family protein [Tepidiforma thermophila]|uniref:1-acyl-sn-glycerol-3-phosphate acyltransferase n=1 Tax=Tepidiforma thermophila (strain KCTC 52669 / CGMCC 1.13589 / G233) TaxID=2761530 RepID=A0A2A9HDL6_TEPT2|nr:lysophospholipid acyltransferase family protein [Tepidiforma thermophila]PFG74107.1 1-acyl-sn-glycerol-3-phosphate acyltransferase [Tepidiforma thermophila]
MRLKLPKLRWETFVPPFYWACTYLLRGALWLVVRWEVRGREHVPMEGGLIVVSNHLNNADPPIVGAGVAKRRIRWMAKVELFRYPFGVIPRLWGAFPVRRFEADLGAMLTAERILRQGGVLGMFPEGTRSKTGYFGTLHPGTALIALRTGAPVLPCAVTGTEKLRNPLVLLRRPRFTVTIGEPIRVEAVKRPTEEQVSALTERIAEAIRSLLPPGYRGPYTGGEGSAPGETDGPDHPRE